MEYVAKVGDGSMDNNGILEQVRNACSDIEKMYFISGITNDKVREEAILLLEDDNNKLRMIRTLRDEAAVVGVFQSVIGNEKMTDKVIRVVSNLESLDLKDKLRIYNKIPDSSLGKKVSVISGCILDEDCSEDERKYIESILTDMYCCLHMKDSEFSCLEFMKFIDNEYVVANILPMFNITDKERKQIISQIKDSSLRENLLLIYASKEELQNKIKIENVNKLNLPNNITFGIELEAEGKMFGAFFNYEICGRWEGRDESTIINGVEVVSPKLYNKLQDISEIYMVCNIMEKCGMECSERCGGHIHIGSNLLDTKEALEAFIMLWLANEKVIYKISNKENEDFRDGIELYAIPISHKFSECSKIIYSELSQAKTRDDLVNVLKKIQRNGRSNGINLNNINDKEKDTIEFRIPNGTLDANEIINNIKLYGRIMQRANEISEISEKIHGKNMLSESEIRMFRKFRKLCLQDLSEEERR